MEKIELEIVALSHSMAQTHSYVVVLGEVNGLRRLPIIIGGAEAQAIAVALEDMKPARPLTHDLTKNMMNAFEIDLLEVIISDLQEGVFFAKLVCSSQHDTVEIDSRTSDAIAMAVRFGCPIYTTDAILDSAVNNGDEPAAGTKKKLPGGKTKEPVKEKPAGSAELGAMSIAELENHLNEVLEQEDYMRAIAIRDELKRRKGN
ncbi:MAG: bifunctional nuclease family protein [Bacteroidetes bacterium]|nr:bifunctional nuclease family protein [Bacteroidota bacterium]